MPAPDEELEATISLIQRAFAVWRWTALPSGVVWEVGYNNYQRLRRYRQDSGLQPITLPAPGEPYAILLYGIPVRCMTTPTDHWPAGSDRLQLVIPA